MFKQSLPRMLVEVVPRRKAFDRLIKKERYTADKVEWLVIDDLCPV